MDAHRKKRRPVNTPPSVLDSGNAAQFPREWHIAQILGRLLTPMRSHVWVVAGDALQVSQHPDNVSLEGYPDLERMHEQLYGEMLELPGGHYATETAMIWRCRHLVREEWNQLFAFRELPEGIDAWCDRLDGALTAEEKERFYREETEFLLSIGEGNWCVRSEDESVTKDLFEACPEIESQALSEIALYH